MDFYNFWFFWKFTFQKGYPMIFIIIRQLFFRRNIFEVWCNALEPITSISADVWKNWPLRIPLVRESFKSGPDFSTLRRSMTGVEWSDRKNIQDSLEAIRAFAIPLLRIGIGNLRFETAHFDWKLPGKLGFFGIQFIWRPFLEKVTNCQISWSLTVFRTGNWPFCSDRHKNQD